MAGDEDVDVVFRTREKGRYFVKTATEMGNEEGTAVRIILCMKSTISNSLQSVTARARNAFGGAETLEANLSLGTKTRRAYQASFSLPLSPSLNTTGILSVFRLDRDNSSYASSTEGLRGLKAVVRVRFSCQIVEHTVLMYGMQNKLAGNSYYEVAYEAVFRHISGLTPTASIRYVLEHSP